MAANEPEESASERESSGEDSVEDEEEVNESSRTEETARHGEVATNQRGGASTPRTSVFVNIATKYSPQQKSWRDIL